MFVDYKEVSRATVKGGRVSPATRPPQPPRAPVKPAPRTAEALAILVQHLVFNLEAFDNPNLKKQLERSRKEATDALQTSREIEQMLLSERQKNLEVISEERDKFNAEIMQLIEKHRQEIIEIKAQNEETEKIIQTEKSKLSESYKNVQDEQQRVFKNEFEKLQKTHQESLEILREENDAIREEIDEKIERIKELETYKFESEKLRKDYEAKEIYYKEKLAAMQEEVALLKEQNETFFNVSASSSTSSSSGSGSSAGDNSLQEVQSLRAVLELKQSEVAELRKSLAEALQKADMLPIAEEKISGLTAKCEDLLHQLERKNEYETHLLAENKKMQGMLKEESNQKRRLSQYNEELQWKLQQNKEVVTRVLEEAEATAFNRSNLSASFSERHYTTPRNNFERTLSFRDARSKCDSAQITRKCKNSFEIEFDDISPPSSPKVKGVVEKSDSVSYVLEMDESPEVVASRIVRRSFRNATPPKNTPTKSPANKRPRKNAPLSLSSSTSAIMGMNKMDVSSNRARSATIRNNSECQEDVFSWQGDKKFSSEYWNGEGDFEEDLDIKLPALPSEIGRKNGTTLPVPKHLAGEAMLSESNSEDESSVSSSSGQL